MRPSSWIQRGALLALASFIPLVQGLGCGAEPESNQAADHPAAAALRRSFPQQSPRVLDRAEPFTTVAAGFALRADPRAALNLRAGLRLDLPALGGDAVRLHAPAGSDREMEVRVIEHGLTGEGAVAGGAVAYPRTGGTSFWASSEGGFEEWLALDAGLARKGQVVASWTVEGGTLAEEGGVVIILDDAGIPRLRVTAPAAFAAGGRPVTPELDVHGDTIDLTVDAGGEAVLVDPSWTATPNMNHSRDYGTATLLQSGKVLLTGGPTGNGDPTAEVYDPVANTWTPTTNNMASGRFQHAAALLSSGKVLVTGGSNGGVLATTSIYDPLSNSFTAGPNMTVGHFRHTATTLGSTGKVLITGGWNGPSLATCEIYDPTANSFTATTSMNVAREYHAATLLGNGKVLVVGGDSNNGGATFLTSAELFDPAAIPPTWTLTGAMATPRSQHAAVLLASGKVLVAGGYNNNAASLASAEVYDPTGGSWASGGTMTTARSIISATLFTPLGKVLVVGSGSVVDLYDPAANTWAATAPLTYSFSGSGTLTMLNNSTALAAGGSGGLSAAIFSVANGTPCTTNGECGSDFCVDGVCCNSACTGLCQACSTAKKGAGTPNGVCGTIAVGTDPDNECATQSASTCGTTGSCSGAGACQLYANGTTCTPLSCSGNTLVGAALCNGTGTCVPGVSQSCGNYICSGSACLTSCMTNAQCSGANVCIGGQCVGLLGNGQPCVTANQCSSNFCVDGVCCNNACNGGACDACSVAAGGMVNGTCSLLTGNACDDKNACTTGDVCQAGTCAGSAVVCMAQDSCHGVGACNPANGVCSNPALQDGSPCSDGDGCTANDTCAMGACQAGSPVTCAPIDACHTAGTCDSNTGACTAGVPVADGAACDDGDACTQTDVCTGGKCGGAPIACPAAGPCNDVAACDPKTGMCPTTPKADGTSCNDGDECTTGDTCMAGACVAGTPITCTAMDLCHDVGSCTAGVCSNPSKNIDCTAKSPCENDGTCDGKTGECLKSNKPDGSPCPSGTCIAGSCVADPTSTSAGGTGSGGGSAGTAGTASTGSGPGATGSGGGSSGTLSSGPSATGSGGNGSGGSGAEGGCSCETTGASTASNTPWLLLGLGLLLGRKRSQRGRKAA